MVPMDLLATLQSLLQIAPENILYNETAGFGIGPQFYHKRQAITSFKSKIQNLS